MAHTAYTICNAALVLVGADRIDTFEDETREAEVAGILYPIILDDLLTRNPWNFAVKQSAALNRLDEVPEFDYAYAYQLPPDCIEVVKLESADAFEIDDDKLLTSAEEAKISYKQRPNESSFKPQFVRMLISELCSEFAVSLGEDASKGKLYEGRAEKQETKARHTDSKQKTTQGPRQSNFSLLTVRH